MKLLQRLMTTLTSWIRRRKLMTPEEFIHSELVLIVWNRFDRNLHEQALRLLCQFAKEEGYKSETIPLIRPIGRPLRDYLGFDTSSHKSAGTLPTNVPILISEHLGLCEMWIQVSRNSVDKVWQELLDWISQNGHGRCWGWTTTDSIWQPLGASNGYAKVVGDPQAEHYLSKIEKHLPYLLKILWYKSSTIIVDYIMQGSDLLFYDPATENSKFLEMLTKICETVNPSNFGLLESGVPLDPTRIHVSHMSTFALNAITEVRNIKGELIYQLGQYFGDHNLSHPYLFPTCDQYIAAFRTAAVDPNISSAPINW